MTKCENIIEIAQALGIPVVDIKMTGGEVEKPVSMEQWNNIRILQLKEYIAKCLDKSVKIDQQFIDEYNSLI